MTLYNTHAHPPRKLYLTPENIFLLHLHVYRWIVNYLTLLTGVKVGRKVKEQHLGLSV